MNQDSSVDESHQWFTQAVGAGLALTVNGIAGGLKNASEADRTVRCEAGSPSLPGSAGEAPVEIAVRADPEPEPVIAVAEGD